MNIRKIIVLFILLNSSAFSLESLSTEALGKVNYKKEIVPLLGKYCYDCHDADSEKGDLDLESFITDKTIITQRKEWIKCAELLSNREMPAENKKKNIKERHIMG